MLTVEQQAAAAELARLWTEYEKAHAKANEKPKSIIYHERSLNYAGEARGFCLALEVLYPPVVSHAIKQRAEAIMKESK
jgi:hypothetical protein